MFYDWLAAAGFDGLLVPAVFGGSAGDDGGKGPGLRGMMTVEAASGDTLLTFPRAASMDLATLRE